MRLRTLLLFVPLLALAACNEDASNRPQEACSDANTFAWEGARYCVVIEEGFLSANCPDGLPEGRDFEDFFLCSDADDISDEAADEARSRGFGGGQACTPGDTQLDDDGCNTCTCSDEGDWVCTTRGCVSFEDCMDACPACEDPDEVEYVAQSSEQCSLVDFTCDDGQVGFSNECGCGCKPADEPECTEGDVMGLCDECTCIDGEWLCTDLYCFDACIADCPECEDPELDSVDYLAELSECDLIDFICEDGWLPFRNECGCGCVQSDDPVECEPGSTMTEECNECVCGDDGLWQCDTRDCSELELCLEACGIGCPAPEFQECGVDGNNYCSACNAECYGVALADTRELCECSPPEGDVVRIAPWEIPADCRDRNPEGGESGVAYTSDDAARWIDCEGGTGPRFESGNSVLLRAVFEDNPDAITRGVYSDRGADAYVVYMTARQYCGGPAPISTVEYYLLPFGDETRYDVDTCTHTTCDMFFP